MLDDRPGARQQPAHLPAGGLARRGSTSSASTTATEETAWTEAFTKADGPLAPRCAGRSASGRIAPYAAAGARACSGWPSSSSTRRSRCSWCRCGPGTSRTGFEQTWNWGIYPEAFTEYWPWIGRSIVYGGLATLLAFALGFPLAYAIAFRGGRYKNLLLFLVIAPFFTSFLLRTICWKIILGDDGLVLGPAQGRSASSRRTSSSWRRPLAVVAGHHLQLPAVHDPAAVRRPREDRPAPGRGGRGPVRRPVAAAGHDRRRRSSVGPARASVVGVGAWTTGRSSLGDPGPDRRGASSATWLISEAFIRVTLPLAPAGHLRRARS